MKTTALADRQRLLHVLDAFPDVFTKLDEEQQRVSLAIYRLLAQGEPTNASSIAAHADVSQERVEALLNEWPGIYRDEAGRIIGYWGITPTETSHRLELPGRTVFAWCAWDTLFIPQLIGEPADVVSRNPVTGEDIRLTVTADGARSTDGSEIYVSFLEPDEGKLTDDVVGSFCHYVFFFSSLEEGEGWVAAHPGTYLLSLDQAFGLGRRKNARQYPDLLTDEKTTPRPEGLSAAGAAAIDNAKRTFGFVPNLIREMAERSPAVAQVYLEANKAISAGSLSPVEREALSLAVSAHNNCHYCIAVHTTVGRMVGISEEDLRAIKKGVPPQDPGLRSIVGAARRVLNERGWLNESDVTALAASGVTREELYEIVALVGIKTISNYINHIAHTEVDAQFTKPARAA